MVGGRKGLGCVSAKRLNSWRRSPVGMGSGQKFVMYAQFKASFRCLGAMLCLLAYLCTATVLVPGGAALLAWLGAEHRVTMASTPGGVRIVLHHDLKAGDINVGHAHGILSRTVTLFAQYSTPGEPDHVLDFAQCGGAAKSDGPALPSLDEVEIPTEFVPALAWILPAPPTKARVSLGENPPLGASLAIVRSTVLLI